MQDALAEITALLRKHRLVEGLVHEQLEHAPVGDHDGPRRDRREPRHQAEQGAAPAQARPAAPGRHRVHPRGAAARRAPVHLGPRARGARRRDPARGFRAGPRVADLVDGHRGAGRRDGDARRRGDRRAGARPPAGGDGRRVLEPAAGGARAAARRDVLRRRHGRRADGLRGPAGAPRRDARSRAALPAPLRRAAVADRPAVRRRPRREAAGRAAGQPADRQRARDAGRRRDAAARRQAAAAREGGDAASAFERYDLVSAPVVDTNDKLVGRVTVDEILDFVRERGEEEMLAQAGLREEEDVFASVWKSFQNRWTWLAINLVTAFIASRVIGVFEGSIEKLVALAALMPIVAGIGGNSGNQTITMIVRAVALGQVTREHARKLFRKEIIVALINGLVWGGVMGARRDAALQGRRARARDGARDDAQPDARGVDGRADSDDDAASSAAIRRSARRC